MDRCRTINGIHIPGCMGCAVYGHYACTCERTPRQSIESRYNEALRKIAAMGSAEMSAAGDSLRYAVGLARAALAPQKPPKKKG